MNKVLFILLFILSTLGLKGMNCYNTNVKDINGQTMQLEIKYDILELNIKGGL